MNRQEITIVILLILCIPVWMFIDSNFIAPRGSQPAISYDNQQSNDKNIIFETSKNLSPKQDNISTDNSIDVTKTSQKNIKEEIIYIQNENIKLDITSKGGGIKSVHLFKFLSQDDPNSPEVILNFDNLPALTYSGLNNLTTNNSLNLKKINSNEIQLDTLINDNIRFERKYKITNSLTDDDYLVKIQDRFINLSNELQELDKTTIHTGFMSNPEGTHKMWGEYIVGADSFSSSDGIFYWGRNGYLNKLVFPKKSQQSYINITPKKDNEIVTVDWISAKNKFFAQILDPTDLDGTVRILCFRDNKKAPTEIASALNLKASNIKPNQSIVYNYNYYVGPKDYNILKKYDQSYEKIREYEIIGFWSGWNFIMEPVRKGLNTLLVAIANNKFIPGGIGVAIILLTILMRIIFHPLHKKSTNSMKKMQEIQPELKALQEKYKKDPKRLQRETMELYKSKKVNPMGGCLPMLVQIPIFIALYTVLRGAIELRFIDFLWIKDLSGPENLLAGKIPLINSLNILPILMAASMIMQQKVTSAATAITPEQKQQQKIMMFMMPIMMLVFFYNMPSGLVLYWTVSNLLMVGMTGLKKFKKQSV